MNRDTQAKVRMLADRVVADLVDRNPDGAGIGVRDSELIATLEIARQVSILSDELHRLNRKLDGAKN